MDSNLKRTTLRLTEEARQRLRLMEAINDWRAGRNMLERELLSDDD